MQDPRRKARRGIGELAPGTPAKRTDRCVPGKRAPWREAGPSLRRHASSDDDASNRRREDESDTNAPGDPEARAARNPRPVSPALLLRGLGRLLPRTALR